jgi:hypothetical protein
MHAILDDTIPADRISVNFSAQEVHVRPDSTYGLPGDWYRSYELARMGLAVTGYPLHLEPAYE